ncbi:MAG: TrkA family potassium uptake protein, partial [Opitutaceae bacterium]|nr:TrkA family potassium uptake protein [Opitutaceae bacterium]
MKACIIGLGVFGRSLALTLAELGVEVVALDLSETLVAAIKDEVSVAAVADASNPEALAMFPMAEMDVVVVGIGQDFEASLQATAHAQELGAKRVITRVLSPVHERLLKLMKVERAVVPEEVAAKTLGKSLVLEGVTGLYELDAKYSIVELPVPESLIGVKPRQS